MNTREFFAKRRAHVIFAGALIFVLALNVIVGFTSGLSVLEASWKAVNSLRPMEYVLFALFWYMCAVHRPKDGWDTSLTSLNLSQLSNQK